MKPFSSRPFYAFRSRDAAVELIALCAGVFVVYAIVNFGFHKPELLNWLVAQNDWRHSLQKPWSLVTYAFVHLSFLGLLFNMVFLYFTAQLFYTFFSQKSLLTLFFVGALAGSLSFQLVTLGSPLTRSLTGASAGIYALFTAICTYRPSCNVYLFGAFRLKVIYLLVALIGINVLYLLNGVNTGGEIAHFGAMAGSFLYTRALLLRGKTLEDYLPFKRLGLWVQKRRGAEHTLSVVKSPNPRLKSKIEEQLDEILEKISRSGYKSLSRQEKKFLKKASDELGSNKKADKADSDA